jgi:hypothetical protein
VEWSIFTTNIIHVSVWEQFPGWVVNLFIAYREGTQSSLATFMLDQIWPTRSEAIEAGFATAKRWIDQGKP